MSTIRGRPSRLQRPAERFLIPTAVKSDPAEGLAPRSTTDSWAEAHAGGKGGDAGRVVIVVVVDVDLGRVVVDLDKVVVDEVVLDEGTAVDVVVDGEAIAVRLHAPSTRARATTPEAKAGTGPSRRIRLLSPMSTRRTPPPPSRRMRPRSSV